MHRSMSTSTPNVKITAKRIAKCRYKTKIDKCSAFGQVDLTAQALEVLALIPTKGKLNG